MSDTRHTPAAPGRAGSRTRTAQRQRSRSRLIEVAVERISTHGPAGASVQEIAQRAGLTTGAVYHQFSGRDELLRAATAFALRHRSPLAEAADTATTVEDLLVGEALATMRLIDDLDQQVAHLLRVQLQLLLAAAHDEEARSAMTAFIVEERAALVGQIERLAVAEGAAFKTPIVELADGFFALVRGFVMIRMAGPALCDDDLVAATVRRMVACARRGTA